MSCPYIKKDEQSNLACCVESKGVILVLNNMLFKLPGEKFHKLKTNLQKKMKKKKKMHYK